MKQQLILITTLIISTLLLTGHVTAHAASSSIYPQNISKSLVLREDLPSYVFEYDLERLYPATWEFYKKLDIIKRDKVYSHYLYNPAIKDVRHHIFKLALGADKGKTTPAPTSFNQVLVSNDTNPNFSPETDPSHRSTFGSLNLSGIHRVTDSPAVRTVQFYTNTNQSIYSFLQYN